ncbi:MAG: methionine gamma-lyase family protein [Eubacteriales bacterium]|nr:methionine gamma-lyase family protein [Eubacteriales bacterium]
MFENKAVFDYINECEDSVRDIFRKRDGIALYNEAKVLGAMQRHKLAERHFTGSTGYGYNDDGRDVTEKIYADVFGGEAALVRPQIVSGTHAVSLCLYAVLRPGDNFISMTGQPYDTIYSNIGVSDTCRNKGTLADFGIGYKQIEFTPEGKLDLQQFQELVDENTRAVFFQRSTGYSMRTALTIDALKEAIAAIKDVRRDIVVIVDNCYGEFLEKEEPCDVNADLIAGSLIKNPGGGLASSGGYIVGRSDLVELAAGRLTMPSIAFEVGAMPSGTTRNYMQGFFIAPSVVNSAVKGAILTAKALSGLGFEVFPKFDEARSDIIQAVVLNDRQKLIDYCQAVQFSSPVDSYVSPEPWDMPGYVDQIIMAAGNFIQGSSIELSADSPMKEPFIVYQQGGLTYEHVKIALYNAIVSLKLM